MVRRCVWSTNLVNEEALAHGGGGGGGCRAKIKDVIRSFGGSVCNYSLLLIVCCLGQGNV